MKPRNTATEPVIKTCGCGLKYTPMRWKTLKLIGMPDDGHEKLELRNCACGSTIAVLIAVTCPTCQPLDRKKCTC